MSILEITFRYGEGWTFGTEQNKNKVNPPPHITSQNKIKLEHNESGYFEKAKNKIMLFF